MKLARTRLRRGRHIPGRSSAKEGDDLGPGEVIGSWVLIHTDGGPVLLWGDDVGPSEVDADTVQRGEAAPARGRARPPGTDST